MIFFLCYIQLLIKMQRSSIVLSTAQGQEAEQKYKKFLQKIAINPKYQYFIAAFVTIGIALNVFNVMIGSFVFMNPIFICEGASSTEQQACEHLDLCIIQNNFTAVYKNKLYCEKQLLRSTIQSALGYGYIIGRISFPILSDLIGRRSTMLLNFACGILTMSFLLLGIEYNSDTLMIIGQVLSGIFGSGVSTMGGIYSCDFCCRKIRDFCITNAWAIWGLVQMFFYVLYEYIPGWKFYLTATLLIPSSIIFLLLLFFLIESPVYAIFVKKSPKMVNQIVEQLSWFNQFSQEAKNELKENAKQIILLLQSQQKVQENYFKVTLRRIFCQMKNLKVIISFTFIGLSYIFFYFGMQGSMESSGYNFGVTMLVVGFTEFAGYFISAPIAQKLKRRSGIFVSTIITSSVGILFAFQFVEQSQGLQTALVAAARFLSNFFYCLYVLFYYESLEVQIRSLSFSIIDGASQLARIVIPYSINIMYGLKLHPIIGFSVLFILMGALPVLPLKQTYSKKSKQKSLITEKQTEYVKNQAN